MSVNNEVRYVQWDARQKLRKIFCSNRAKKIHNSTQWPGRELFRSLRGKRTDGQTGRQTRRAFWHLSKHITQLWRRYYANMTSVWRNYFKMALFWGNTDVIITSLVYCSWDKIAPFCRRYSQIRCIVQKLLYSNWNLIDLLPVKSGSDNGLVSSMPWVIIWTHGDQFYRRMYALRGFDDLKERIQWCPLLRKYFVGK